MSADDPRPEGRFEDRNDVKVTVALTLLIAERDPSRFDLDAITDKLYEFAGGESWPAVWDVSGDDFVRIVQAHETSAAA